MIQSEADMTPEERGSVIAIHLDLNKLVFDYPKVQSRPIPSCMRVPGDLLTPGLVRSIVRRRISDLERADMLEHYVLRRLKIGGVEFFDWERDPSVMAQKGMR